MKLHALLLLVLTQQSLLASAQHPAIDPPAQVIKNCEKRSKESVHRVLPQLLANGKWRCMVCAGEIYNDPKTKVEDCCEDLGQVFKTDATATEEGACCDPDQKYSFDSSSGKGGCCAPCETFKGDKCQCSTSTSPTGTPSPSSPPPSSTPPSSPPPSSTPPSSPPPSSPPPSSTPPSSPPPSSPPPSSPPPSSPPPSSPPPSSPPPSSPPPSSPPRDPCNKCSGEFVCACPGNLGIVYGKCYTLTDVNGLPLNRQINGVYKSGGDIGNLIFKVCKTTEDCDESSGTPVPSDGTWSFQDQLGIRDEKGPGWFGDVWVDMRIVKHKEKSKAAVFTGEPLCFFGNCSLCLRLGGGPNGPGGLSAPCDLGANAAMAHVGAAKNPNICKAFRFQEIPCLKNVLPKGEL